MASALAPDASCTGMILLEIKVAPAAFKKFRTLASSSPLWLVMGFSYVKLLARNIWVLLLAKYISARDGLSSPAFGATLLCSGADGNTMEKLPSSATIWIFWAKAALDSSRMNNEIAVIRRAT